MLGWYFAEESKRLRYGDDRNIELGKTHAVSCEPILCQQGLHASKRIIDALQYAPGNIIYQIKLSHNIVHGNDKSVAKRRKYLAGGVDIGPELRLFARQCALDVIHLWDAPQVVVDYLNTGDERLMAVAEDAARSAVRSAAWATTRGAARDAWAAAWSAARDAASGAARCAAWTAARAAEGAARAAAAAAREAARDAAWAAAREAARDARDAAWAAAWAAASGATPAAAAENARNAQNIRLEQLVLQRIKEVV
jgi:hypothetical protein